MLIRQSLNFFLAWGRLWLPLFLCLNAFAEDPARSAEWKNLLHYKDKSSIIDAAAFFLSPNGRNSPENELQASLKAIDSNETYGRLKQPFACAFPARMKFLKKKFSINNTTKCDELDTWLKGLNPKTMSLIFASYYPNNPASIFGHTFLKINSSPDNKISDYAINYLAITSESNGLIFGLKGLLGMYRGQFSVLPYFIKVNEYNHSESRDLFEYELNLTEDEIDTLLKHVWELENNGYFDYYFLDENCSYFLMRLLDVARPELELSRKFPFEVLPAETVKVVYQNGLSRKAIYRPSLYTELDARMKSRPKDIDTQILLKQFKKLAQKSFSKKDAEEYHELLIQRSKLASPLIEDKLLPRSFPHETHAPKALSLGTGIIKDQTFTRLSLRPGLHNLLDPEAGYLPFSAVELMRLSLRSYFSRQIYLDEVTLMDIATLNPHKSWNPKFSWKSKVQFLRFDQDLCHGCETTRFSSSLGKSLILRDAHLLSVFIGAQILYGTSFERRISYGLNPEVSYHFAGRKVNLETSMTLINRFDQHAVMDSLKFGQGLGLKINNTQSLQFKGRYYAPISKHQETRYETMLEWTRYY